MALTDQDVINTYNMIFDQLRVMAQTVEQAAKDDPATPGNESAITGMEGMAISAYAMNMAMFLMTVFKRDHKEMGRYADVASRVVLTLPDAG